MVPKRGKQLGDQIWTPKQGFPGNLCASVSFVKSSIFARSSPADLRARGKVAVRVSGKPANRGAKGCLA